MSTMEYKDYVAQVEYDDSVNEFSGTTINMRDVLFFSGTTVKELTRSFHKVVDAYLDWCKSDGVEPDKPYQGNVSLRLSPQLHRDIDLAAKRQGKSINTFIEETVSKALKGHSVRTPRRRARAR